MTLNFYNWATHPKLLKHDVEELKWILESLLHIGRWMWQQFGNRFPLNFGRPRWRSLSPENFPLTSSFRLFLVSVFSISAELLPLSLTFASSRLDDLTPGITTRPVFQIYPGIFQSPPSTRRTPAPCNFKYKAAIRRTKFDVSLLSPRIEEEGCRADHPKVLWVLSNFPRCVKPR